MAPGEVQLGHQEETILALSQTAQAVVGSPSWGCSRTMGMWHGGMVGWGWGRDLRGLFQPQ